MKTNILILSVSSLFVAGILSSCTESWLDVASKTESNSSNYYKSQDDGLRSLYACYDGWQRKVWSA